MPTAGPAKRVKQSVDGRLDIKVSFPSERVWVFRAMKVKKLYQNPKKKEFSQLKGVAVGDEDQFPVTVVDAGMDTSDEGEGNVGVELETYLNYFPFKYSFKVNAALSAGESKEDVYRAVEDVVCDMIKKGNMRQIRVGSDVYRNVFEKYALVCNGGLRLEFIDDEYNEVPEDQLYKEIQFKRIDAEIQAEFGDLIDAQRRRRDEPDGDSDEVYRDTQVVIESLQNACLAKYGKLYESHE